MKKKRSLREITIIAIKDKKKRIIIHILFLIISVLLFIISYNVNIVSDLLLALCIAIFISSLTLFFEIFKIYSEDGDSYKTLVDDYLNKNCLFCKTSLEGVYKNREEINLLEKFERAKKQIKILVTNLDSIKDRTHLDCLKECAERGVEIQICTLHPDEALYFNIHRATGNTTPEVRFNQMRDSLLIYLKYFKKCKEEIRNNVKIKVYKQMPTIITFIVDNHCYLGFMVYNNQARDIMHIQFNLEKASIAEKHNKNIITAEIFNKHFDAIFLEESQDIDIRDVEKIKFSEDVNFE